MILNRQFALEKFENYFEEAVSLLGFTLSSRQKEQCSQYAAYLLAVNATMNLTRIVAPDAVAVRHFADSLTVFHALPSLPLGAHLVDVGTGAGFPGMVLKIVRPDLKVTLLDSLAKRLTFLRETAELLQLEGVETVHSRAEDAGRSAILRDTADVVVARAVAALPTLLEWCAPLVRPNGVFIAMKSETVNAEITDSEAARRLLKLDAPQILSVTLPSIGDENAAARRLVCYRKNAPTPQRYPRRASEIKNSPLGMVNSQVV